MKCKLTKISRPDGAPGGPRTDTIEGKAVGPPVLGAYFEMTGKPLTEGAVVRYVSTSRVMAMEPVEGGSILTTESGSRYRLEFEPVGA
jgi:hypothetical protein